jgi:hypothetical protein
VKKYQGISKRRRGDVGAFSGSSKWNINTTTEMQVNISNARDQSMAKTHQSDSQGSNDNSNDVKNPFTQLWGVY